MLSIKDIDIKQLDTQLHLSWHSLHPVRLMRDGELLYSGSAHEYIDTGLSSLSPVQYEIHDGKTRITIDTALVEDENPLFWNQKSTLIIRSEKELYLKWGAIPNVESYSIFRDGKRLGDTSSHEWYQAIGANEYSRYEIRALRSASKKQTPFSSVIEGSMKLLNTMKQEPDREREYESFILYITIHPFGHTINKVKENTTRARLRILTFIAPPILKNPNPFSPHIYFEGDDRTYDAHASEYRTFTEVALSTLQETPQVDLNKQANPTRSLTSAGRLRSEDVASTRQVYLKNIVKHQKMLQFTTYHSVGNPLVVAPDINYSIHTAYQKGNWRLSGTHLRSPHHEIYLQTESNIFEPIHQTHDLGLSFLADPLPSCHWLFIESR